MPIQRTRDPLLKRKVESNGKARRKHTVMQDEATIEAICLAEMGKGNDVCRTKYGIAFSDGQFQYRLTKGKIAAGLQKGDGFRKAWREGRSSCEDLVHAVLPELRKEYYKKILPAIEKPAVQASPIKAA